MRARERSEALLLTLADGRGRKAKAARCARALIRRFAPPSPASQEKGWDCWTFRCEGKTGLATEPRSHKKLPGHRNLSLMPDTHPEAIPPAPPPPLLGRSLPAFFYDPSPRSDESTSELPLLMRISLRVFCMKKKITN